MYRYNLTITAASFFLVFRPQNALPYKLGLVSTKNVFGFLFFFINCCNFFSNCQSLVNLY